MSIRLPNSCFVHIPRTGGLWLGRVIEELGIKHQTLKGDIDSHFRFNQLPDNWRELHSFSFVRHPFDWVRSRWSHALDIQAYDNYRHYGVHREFDECVRPTLRETIEVILKDNPGIVSYTYSEMTRGVRTLLRTENIRNELYTFLTDVEVLPDNAEEIIQSVEPFNGTSTLSQYCGDAGYIPEKLKKQFLESEREALTMWKVLE
jgi:hypothetical protein